MSSGGFHLGGGVAREEGGEFLRYRFDPAHLEQGCDVDRARRMFDARCEAYERLAPAKLKVSAWLRVARVVRGSHLDVERVGHPLIEDTRPDVRKLERILACVYWGMADARRAGLGPIGEISPWRVRDVGGKKNAVAYRMEPAFGFVREHGGYVLRSAREDDRFREASEADDVRSIGELVFAVAANRAEVSATDRVLRVPFPRHYKPWQFLSEGDERVEELWSRRRCEDLVVGLGDLRTLESIRDRMPARPRGLKEPPAGPSPEDSARRDSEARHIAEREVRQREEKERDSREREARAREEREARERVEREAQERADRARRAQEKREFEAREREDEAARLREGQARQREQAARDAERQRAQDEAARERAALEQADREHEDRERRAKAAAAREKQERETRDRERQERERREQEKHERERREREARERESKDRQRKEQEGRERERQERERRQREARERRDAPVGTSPRSQQSDTKAGARESTDSVAQDQKPASRKGVLIGIAGAVVLVAAAGAYFALGGGKPQPAEPEPPGPIVRGNGPDGPDGNNPPKVPDDHVREQPPDGSGTDIVKPSEEPIAEGNGQISQRESNGWDGDNGDKNTDDPPGDDEERKTRSWVVVGRFQRVAGGVMGGSQRLVPVARFVLDASRWISLRNAWDYRWSQWKLINRSIDLEDWVKAAEEIVNDYPQAGGRIGLPIEIEAQIKYNKSILASRDAAGGEERNRAESLLRSLDDIAIAEHAPEGVRDEIERARDALRDLLDRADTRVPSLSFPGITGAGWQPVGQGGDDATFRHERTGLKMTYVRLRDGDRPIYMSKTEVSIGQVSALLAERDDIVKNLTKSDGSSPEPWAELRERKGRSGLPDRERFETWEWRDERIKPTRSIFVDDDDTTGESQSILPGLFTDGDDDDQIQRPEWPIQDISARASQELARELFGGRLPSVDEYDTAFSRVGAQGENPLTGANLRSDGFFDQVRHAAEVSKKRDIANPFYLDKFMTNWRNRVEFSGKDAARWPSHPSSDGATFFVPVNDGGGQPFQHLVGNVAEWASEGNQFRIIGASALSAPELGFQKATEDGRGRVERESRGLFDVGFRVVIEGEWSLAGEPPASDDDIARALNEFPEWRD